MIYRDWRGPYFQNYSTSWSWQLFWGGKVVLQNLQKLWEKQISSKNSDFQSSFRISRFCVFSNVFTLLADYTFPIHLWGLTLILVGLSYILYLHFTIRLLITLFNKTVNYWKQLHLFTFNCTNKPTTLLPLFCGDKTMFMLN